MLSSTPLAIVGITIAPQRTSATHDAALRHLSAIGEQERPIVGLGARLGDREATVVVIRERFRASRHAVVVDPRPGADAGRHAAVCQHLRREAPHVDDHLRRRARRQQLLTDDPLREHPRSHVHVAPTLVGSQDREDSVDHLVEREPIAQLHDLQRLDQALHVLAQPEHVELLAVDIPVGLEALEHRRHRRVADGVHMNRRLVPWHDVAVAPDVGRVRAVGTEVRR